MCNLGEFTQKKNIPKQGEYGCSVVTQVVRNFGDRMPNRMNATRLKHDGIPMSNGTVQAILNRVADALSKPAEEIKQLIQKCNILNVDETSARYNGGTVWLWTFHDPQTKRNYYLFDTSRGADALKKIIGENHDITLVCDGWEPYKKYTIQRCNAHLVREIKTLSQKNPECIPAKTAYEIYQKIYHDAKSVLCKPPDERAKHYKSLTERTRELITLYTDDVVIGKFMAKLERALSDIFRFVLDPRIPPTNNLAEQSLREYVIQRTIRGCLRSEKSMKRLGDMLTCITTWKNLGIDYATQAAKYI